MQFVTKLVDGSGSNAMNVDGSTTPDVFAYVAVAPTEIFSLTALLNNAGASVFSDFSRSLANGVLVETVVSGAASTVYLIKNKADLTTFFNSQHSEGLSSTSFQGTFFPANNPLLVLQPGDLIRVTVQDNLTAIGDLNMSLLLVQ